MEFENLTPHEIVVFDEKGEKEILRIPPSGKVARVKSEQINTGIEINGVPVVKTIFGEITGLPVVCENCKTKPDKCPLSVDREKIRPKDFCEFQESKKYFIVSTLITQATKKRKDVIAPDTSPESVIRDEKGRIIGIKRFQIF